ncbi:MAG: oligoribonuclease [Lentisphaerae bacterium RIFOXYA12_FULL_48_11]|nr:MAG: oligoribonuclease [Lentisphaerae bacterium RIFOXYA12_FULL_48_11]
MTEKANRRDDYLVWIDCEMTGLDPEKHVLLEIASIITNSDLAVIAEGPVLAIKQSEVELKKMDNWCRRTHRASGLLDRVRNEGVSLMRAERKTLAFLKHYCLKGAAPLCGNSIGQDKRFLVKYMPALHNFFHYKVIDVSSVKLIVSRWYGKKYSPPEKKELHRALSDIKESIAELAYYRDHVFVKR